MHSHGMRGDGSRSLQRGCEDLVSLFPAAEMETYLDGFSR